MVPQHVLVPVADGREDFVADRALHIAVVFFLVDREDVRVHVPLRVVLLVAERAAELDGGDGDRFRGGRNEEAEVRLAGLAVVLYQVDSEEVFVFLLDFTDGARDRLDYLRDVLGLVGLRRWGLVVVRVRRTRREDRFGLYRFRRLRLVIGFDIRLLFHLPLRFPRVLDFRQSLDL